jgi:hypothetical protein
MFAPLCCLSLRSRPRGAATVAMITATRGLMMLSACLVAVCVLASSATAAASSAPQNVSAPVVSGTAQRGDVLTTSTGSWSGTPTAYAYHWQRCSPTCSNISGATVSSYKLQAADVGNTVRSVVTASNSGGSATADSAQTSTVAQMPAPVNTAPPVVSGTAQQGDVLTTTIGSWSGTPTTYAYHWQRCSPKCANIVGATASSYTLQAADVGTTLRSMVAASNAGGTTRAYSALTGTVAASGNGYFSTVPSSETGSAPAGVPRPDATCAAEVRTAPENRPQNDTANHTVPSDPSAVNWGPALNYWTKFVADRNQVTGNFTGTTDEILQWVACKWGIDEDIVRADAVIESDWVQSTVGDNCNVAGEASYGLLQVKNKDCSGNWIQGGWPYTQNDTALDVDYWGARLRACYDGAFYDGGSWLYNGQTIAQVITAHGQDYALWGCIGSWYSGSWYDTGAQNYIAAVQNDYQTKPWLNPGF